MTWKSIDGDTPIWAPIIVAKQVEAHSGVVERASWSFASYDYAVAAYQEDGSLADWNTGEALEGYTLWCAMTQVGE